MCEPLALGFSVKTLYFLQEIPQNVTPGINLLPSDVTAVVDVGSESPKTSDKALTFSAQTKIISNNVATQDVQMVAASFLSNFPELNPPSWGGGGEPLRNNQNHIATPRTAGSDV